MLSAIATVTAPHSASLAWVIRLCSLSCPWGPALSNAAASATDPVPISAATTSDGVGTCTPFNAVAVCNRKGQ